MKQWDIRSFFPPALFLDGQRKCRFQLTQPGKQDYAGSVKRLIRDGVDMPLAHLFVQVASHFPPEAEGADRARSATERFLFRRLETIAQTAGQFRLNVEGDPLS